MNYGEFVQAMYGIAEEVLGVFCTMRTEIGEANGLVSDLRDFQLRIQEKFGVNIRQGDEEQRFFDEPNLATKVTVGDIISRTWALLQQKQPQTAA